MSRRRRVPDALMVVLVAITVLVLAVVPQWRGTLFFYVGDMYEQFAPIWHVFGSQLRSGHWIAMDPAGWMGGNYAAEALLGIWNPVNLVNFVVVSYFDDLALAAFVIMAEMLAVLGTGVYLLARSYGASRAPAFLIAVAMPFSGLTLWYEAAGWPAGLAAFTWVVHFWWSARRFALGRLPAVVPFLFGFLAMTAGNPYAPLGLVVVLSALGIEQIVRRDYARLVTLTIMGACVGAVALMVFLPLLGSSSVTDRQSLAAIANDTFLVPDLGDLVGGTSSTYLPSISNWGGERLESVPSTYLAWFLAPLLPWLRWGSLRRRFVGALSLSIVGGFYLVASLAPSNVWLFRWPFRLVEYLYLAIAVAFAVALSSGIARTHVRRRITLTIGIVLFGSYLAWAVRPDLAALHLSGLLLVAVLVGLAVTLGLRRSVAALVCSAVAGTALILFLQTSSFPSAAQPLPSSEPEPEQPPNGGDPLTRLSDARVGSEAYRGTVLQLAERSSVTTADTRTGQLLFGNTPRAAGVRTVASYTGMGFAAFATELCMDYRGAVCADAFDRLFAPASSNIDAPLVDVMGVSTLVLQRTLLPEVTAGPPPAGWGVADSSNARVVWVRDQPQTSGAGSATWWSPTARVETVASTPAMETVRVDGSVATTVVFSRLAWPGYTAVFDGSALPVAEGPAGLLTVEVPAGEGVLEVRYESPGLEAGRVAAVAAAVIVVGMSVVTALRGRRRARSRLNRATDNG
ncbi:MAG: hypothetical protein WBQ44_10710 [Rhodococcus sp. (in: high G+C Gram-positive bacteria)]